MKETLSEIGRELTALARDNDNTTSAIESIVGKLNELAKELAEREADDNHTAFGKTLPISIGDVFYTLDKHIIRNVVDGVRVEYDGKDITNVVVTYHATNVSTINGHVNHICMNALDFTKYLGDTIFLTREELIASL